MGFENMKKILVMFCTIEYGVVCVDFETTDEVAAYIGTDKYFVEKVLNGKFIKGSVWKPNIFFKPVNEDEQVRYIVVFNQDWVSYSVTKKRNRINKIMG